MTSAVLSRPARVLALPTRDEARDMLARPAVAITVIICATWLASVAIGGVVYLAATGHEPAVVGVFVGGPMLAWAALLMGRLRERSAAGDVVRSAGPGSP